MPTSANPAVRVRYTTENPCRGVNRDIDRSIIQQTELANGVNMRVKSGMVICRGGQSKRNTVAMDDAVFGLIDTEGEFDDYTPAGIPPGIFGTVTDGGIPWNSGYLSVYVYIVDAPESDENNAPLGNVLAGFPLTGLVPFFTSNYHFWSLAAGTYYLFIRIIYYYQPPGFDPVVTTLWYPKDGVSVTTDLVEVNMSYGGG